ncbi:MAG: SDR family oxidoreductase [Castellaniella sp.]
MTQAGKVVLITGAGSGIGAAVARALAQPGAALCLHARGADDASRRAMAAVLADARAAGALAYEVYADLSLPGAGAEVVQTCVAHFGRIDQLVSNAGHASKKGLADAGSQELLAAVQSMAGALLELAAAARPHLCESPCAAIVLTSSFVAHRFRPGELYPLTAAAKAAAEALAMSLAAELAEYGVTVNCVVPGYTLKDPGRYPASDWQHRLPKPPLGRFAEPADVAGAVQYLLGESARHVTGQRLGVDGGLRLG